MTERRDFIKSNAESCSIIRLNNEDVVVTPAFDSLHHWQQNGAWILKVVTEDGFLNCAVAEREANRLLDITYLPVVAREFMVETEHKIWSNYQAELLHDGMFNLGIDEEQVIAEEQNE